MPLRFRQEVQALSRCLAAGERLIHVVAAALTDPDGRVLIAERPAGKILAGHWEFPGGKLEAGETRAHGLARELREELGITIRDPRPLMRVRHTYDFGEVLIDCWVVSRYSGEPQGLDGQRLRWCSLEELSTAELLLADRPLVRALRLPERMSHLTWAAGGEFFTGVRCATAPEALRAVAADYLLLSEALEPQALSTLCESVSMPIYVPGMTLEIAWQQGATGVVA